MRNGFFFGTALVIGGALLIPCLIALGLSHHVAAVIGMVVAVGGFIIQMYTAFKVHFSFEREWKQKQQEHEALMEEVKHLPPEEAIRRLLGIDPTGSMWHP
jgi:hypothetical protein